MRERMSMGPTVFAQNTAVALMPDDAAFCLLFARPRSCPLGYSGPCSLHCVDMGSRYDYFLSLNTVSSPNYES
jgi:hypothetical protein